MFLSIIEIIASWGLWFWRCQMSECVSATKFALRICGNRISIGLWLLHKLLSIFKSCSGSGLLHMGVCVCVCVWPLCQWLVLLTGGKTMTKLRYLIATHAHTHTHKPAHSLIKQSARRARRQPNVNATPGDYFDLQLPHAACCSASTAFNMLQFAESSGKVYAVWQGGRVTGSELPIQLEICASAASYRKNIAYVKCLRLQDPLPSPLYYPSQHIGQHMPCMQHCCKFNTRTCRATNLRVSLLALRHFVCEAECACVSYFECECVRVLSLHPSMSCPGHLLFNYANFRRFFNMQRERERWHCFYFLYTVYRI